MSIALVVAVHEEARRLAIAGSAVASGDFRLARLVAPLEKAAANAPVFGKVADAVSALVAAPEAASAAALLELSLLTNAILYTQGTTGAAGELVHGATLDLGLPPTQATARVLKPLLLALTSTGSGRMELIVEAHGRGAFGDVRVVHAALAALDDGYPDLADFVADEVLPLYGAAILPELRRAFDLAGKAGHARRLRVIHRLDPVGARDLIEAACDHGSKDVKLAAIACLGGSPDDLPVLLEQAGAKAKDLRAAALEGLARFNHEGAVVEAFVKALARADAEIAVSPASKSRNPALLAHLLADGRAQLDSLFTAKDKAELGKRLARFAGFLRVFEHRGDTGTAAFLIECFERRAELATLKADAVSGRDIAIAVGELIATSDSRAAMEAVVAATSELVPEHLQFGFRCAVRVRSAAEVYERYSPYLAASSATTKGKRTTRNRGGGTREVVSVVVLDFVLGAYSECWDHDAYEASVNHSVHAAQLDPRWLDTAIQAGDDDLVCALARPGHTAAAEYLVERFNDTLGRKGTELYELSQLLDAMARIEHADLTECWIAAVRAATATGKKTLTYGIDWLAPILVRLPPTAIPRVEELLPTLPDRVIDELLPPFGELKAKTTTPSEGA